MSRRLVGLTWLAGATVPVALAAFLVGCCALPLHGLAHRLLPLCEMAEAVLTAHEHDGHSHDTPSAPAAPKQDGPDGPRLAWKSEQRTPHHIALELSRSSVLPVELLRRTQLAPSAFRCDDDVGTRLARLDTLRI
jgi:hypothetical protein